MARGPVWITRALACLIVVYALVWLWGEQERWGNWQLTALRAFPVLALALIASAGCILIGHGWPQRSGNDEHCAACGHPWVPEDHILLNHCQECGANWRWFDGRVVGWRQGRPLAITLGAALLLCSLMGVSSDAVTSGMLGTAKPRWAMLKTVQSASARDAVIDWRSLASQASADPAVRNELASAILARRARDASLPYELSNWMHSSTVRGELSSAVIDRWYNEMFELRIEAPALIVEGEPVNVLAAGRFMGGWEGVADVPHICFGGFDIDDGNPPALASTYAIPAASMQGWRKLAAGDVPALHAPGTVKITCRVWLVIGPPMMEVDYGPDGRPIAPLAAAIREFRWAKTVEVVGKAQSDPAPGPTPRATPR